MLLASKPKTLYEWWFIKHYKKRTPPPKKTVKSIVVSNCKFLNISHASDHCINLLCSLEHVVEDFTFSQKEKNKDFQMWDGLLSHGAYPILTWHLNIKYEAHDSLPPFIPGMSLLAPYSHVTDLSLNVITLFNINFSTLLKKQYQYHDWESKRKLKGISRAVVSGADHLRSTRVKSFHIPGLSTVSWLCLNPSTCVGQCPEKAPVSSCSTLTPFSLFKETKCQVFVSVPVLMQLPP